MSDTFAELTDLEGQLKATFNELNDKKAILKDPRFKQAFAKISVIEPDRRADYGKALNQLKNTVQGWINDNIPEQEQQLPIDVTAPFDINIKSSERPAPLDPRFGSIHPISAEIAKIGSIFERMGFEVVGSRELDDDYHMFESLNFPVGHPARDDFDTFMTEEGYIAPAHTSTMQNRVLKERKHLLEQGKTIQVAVPDRVFRNEDLDVTHEHTFYQHEGVMVGKGITVGNLLATLKAFMSAYFEEDLEAKIQPFYFPFTEPSFEFVLQRPRILRKGNSEADIWLELGGCGMVHPNVLNMAGIDPNIYTGFAWGFGVERMIMMKYGIEDIRHFESGKLEFLRQF
ncbi:MAG: phenylalanine--tRNA ligase subunit alpha [Patescibacteria group bacterium]|jgi:phenylalanyl-tRNA synthetase alpha chain|nr:phenylalanine--tRNA ligase subunit alpha [Patescibacteria group bacterium]